eukprot:Ihof_evm2s435 gene=Ihof_evmTU2s435
MKGGNVKEKERKNRSPSARKRDIIRLLKRADLPMTVRVEQERMLAALQTGIEDQKTAEIEKKFSKKYKMVRFFEKRKITRALDTKGKELKREDVTEGEKDEIEKEIDSLKMKLNYVVYFPRTEPYISLYPSNGTLSADSTSRQNEIMETICEAVKEGKLPQVSTERTQKKQTAF